ncbi:MAG: metallophosphoesterase family protein [bacterium]
MKLLLFSDVHRDVRAAERLVRSSAGADVAVCAGDLATQHEGLQEIIDVLSGLRCPAVFVPGNGERFEALREACSDWKGAQVLHGTGATVAGVPFFGVGGGIPVTPFGSWSYDFTEEEAEELLAGCPARGVLVSHSPPKGCLDTTAQGDSLGSTAVRGTVEMRRPLLVVCGHVHACQGRHAMLGATPVVNAGPRGVDWEITIPS